jgi:hypothetical protein
MGASRRLVPVSEAPSTVAWLDQQAVAASLRQSLSISAAASSAGTETGTRL